MVMFARCASQVSPAPFSASLRATGPTLPPAGTYGTNIELSAFVARYRRPVKVYQPNLVYVMPVEDAAPGTSTPPSSSASPALPPADSSETPGADKLTPREKRLLARAEKAKAKGGASPSKSKKGKEREWQPPPPPEPAGAAAEDSPLCIVYV